MENFLKYNLEVLKSRQQCPCHHKFLDGQVQWNLPPGLSNQLNRSVWAKSEFRTEKSGACIGGIWEKTREKKTLLSGQKWFLRWILPGYGEYFALKPHRRDLIHKCEGAVVVRVRHVRTKNMRTKNVRTYKAAYGKDQLLLQLTRQIQIVSKFFF